METAFFTYTLIIVGICAITSVMAFTALMITGNKKFLFVTTMFLFYAVDLMIIFKSEYLNHGQVLDIQAYYSIDDCYLKIFIAAAILESAWMIICDFINEKRMVLFIVPIAVFCVADFLIATLMPDGRLRQMLFYSMREVFIFFMIIFVAVSYHREQDPMMKVHMRSASRFYIVIIVFTCCIVAENSFLIMIWQPRPEVQESLLLLYLSERNFSENTLIVICSFVAIRMTIRTLRAYSDGPQERTAPYTLRQIHAILPRYCKEHGLSQREGEILTLIVQGKDNQNIASELNLAVGTVKSHTHNIMQKAGQASRNDLIKDFWSFS